MALRQASRRCFSASAARLGPAGQHKRAAQDLAEELAEQMALAPKEACATFAHSLEQSGRRQLLRALVASEAGPAGSSQHAELARLFAAHDVHSPHGLLDAAEFEAAVLTDRAARAAKEVASTSGSASGEQSVLTIALASSIPFVGMGAVDNAIMLVAGSEIDAAFGAKLGLSTLAAAGLGNLVSDVAGVSIANRIENLTRQIEWVNNAAFKAARRSSRGRAARFVGSIAGVSVGCLLGMAPLLFMEGREAEHERTHTAGAQG